jgi:transcriptional regulator with XRE-family HTH domain
MSTIQETVGARVRELRKARAWTLEELAEKANKHYTYIGGLERGDRNVTLEVLHAVAGALDVPLKQFFVLEPHPLEAKLNATSDDILSAIQRGFRATIDVKGKLAEYFLSRELESLQREKKITDLIWFDADGKPDFTFMFKGNTLRLECKNVRSPVVSRKNDTFRVELQKTRNSKDGTPTRAYRISHFDLLSVCLFNRTGTWSYQHISVLRLARRKDAPDLLEIMHELPQVAPAGHWKQTILDALLDHEKARKAS